MTFVVYQNYSEFILEIFMRTKFFFTNYKNLTKGDIMKSLQQILKANGQSPSQAYRTGKLEFDKTAGCLVYSPSKVNNFRKEKKRSRKESVTQQ